MKRTIVLKSAIVLAVLVTAYGIQVMYILRLACQSSDHLEIVVEIRGKLIQPEDDPAVCGTACSADW
jgi:hypothetical protein